MSYFRKENVVRFKLNKKSGLLVIFALIIIPIAVHAERKEQLDINREVNELIEDVENKQLGKIYSREIEINKLKDSDYGDVLKELSGFQKIMPGEETKELNGFFESVTAEKKGAANDRNSKLQLYYFISFSMPEKSLIRAVEDAERIQAILTLRGMKNDSMRETMMTIKEYIGERKAQFQIDPVLFEEFNIKMAPALALIESPNCQACGKGEMLLPPIFGDVSISYALKEMKRYSPNHLKPFIDKTTEKLTSNYYEN